MSDFYSDLRNTSFVKSPADAVVDFYEQYVRDLGNVLHRHAPLISRLTKNDTADCMSDDYTATITYKAGQLLTHRGMHP